MPNHSYLVNAARGGIVDETALTELLAQGQIAGAGLDVYENEPDITSALMAMPNVVLLPHIGSATIEGRLSMGDKVIINIRTYIDGHSPPDRVIDGMI
jgi:glyoxylate reductase